MVGHMEAAPCGHIKVKVTRTELFEGAPIRRTPFLLRRGSPCTLPAEKITASAKWTGTRCMHAWFCLQWPPARYIGTVRVRQSLGNGSLGSWASLLQSSVLCLSGDRLAEKPVADWEV